MTTAATTQPGVGDTNVYADPAEFDAEDAFFKNLTGEASDAPASTDAPETEPREAPEGQQEPAQEHQETPEGEPEGTPTEKPATAAERRQAADDDDVVVQVGEESLRVSVKDLKRLYGQEASLTRKSQEVAAQKQAVASEAQKYAAGLDKMAQEATARWDEYQKIDYLLAKDAMEPAQFAQLRSDAQKAFEAHKFYQEEIKNFSQVHQARQQEAFKAAADASKAALADPTNPSHIKDFNEGVYKAVIDFAAKDLGAPEHLLRAITEPWAIKALHLAMQAATAAKATSEVPVVAKPVVKASVGAPVGSREAPASGGGSGGQRQSAAMSRLAKSGDIDDAANAFLAQWGMDK